MTVHSYETPDVFVATFLHSQGAVLTGRVRVGPRRVLFQFAADEKLHELLRVYWRRVPMPLVPAELFASFQYLKSRGRFRLPAQTVLTGKPAASGAAAPAEKQAADRFPPLPC